MTNSWASFIWTPSHPVVLNCDACMGGGTMVGSLGSGGGRCSKSRRAKAAVAERSLHCKSSSGTHQKAELRYLHQAIVVEIERLEDVRELAHLALERKSTRAAVAV